MRAMALAVLARDPEYVPGAAAVGEAGGDKEEVGEPVDVAQHLGVEPFRLMQLDELSFGPSRHRPAEMEGRGEAAAAGEDEGSQRCQLGVEALDPGFAA